jgi:hypothetical protein
VLRNIAVNYGKRKAGYSTGTMPPDDGPRHDGPRHDAPRHDATADSGLQNLIRAASGGDRPPRGFLTRFAERIGTSTSTVSRWRDGTVPDAEWWPRLAEALDLTEAEVRQAATAAKQAPDSMADVQARLERIEQRMARLNSQMDVIELSLQDLRDRSSSRRSTADR